MNEKKIILRKTEKARARSGTIRLKSGIICGILSLSMGISALSPIKAVEHNRKSSPTGNTEAISLEAGNKIHRRKTEYKLPGIVSRHVWLLPQKAVMVNGKRLYNNAVVMNDTVYVALDTLASALGRSSYSYNNSTRTATLSMSGLYLTATDGGFVTYANDRPLFSFSPNVQMSNGKMYIPVRTAAKALGISITENSASTLALSGKYTPLISASKFYDKDEVYWLSKIISAESKGESLLGQIAVGDVILNRVKSPLYPNTIYGVIFDTRYGVQFSPIIDGSIYSTPTYTATLAAKICLEGTSLSDDAMFFLNPREAESSWIIYERKYAYTIGRHDFYL